MNEEQSITLNELKKLVVSGNTSLKIIDIRTADEYNRLHIPVAENIPVEMLDEKASAFDLNDTIVCVCNKGHDRSRNAATLLVNRGFNHSFYLEGGVVGWFESNSL